MKKLLFVLGLTALLISGTAFAQLNWQDNIGVYLDETASVICAQDVVPPIAVPAYLVLTHMTSESVKAWEVKVTSDGPGSVIQMVPRGLAVNAATYPGELIVGLGEPLLAQGGSVVLADLTIYVSGSYAPLYVFVGPIHFDSMGNDLPAYQDGTTLELKRLLPAVGTTANPQLTINGQCEVANEDASFGAVKALFR